MTPVSAAEGSWTITTAARVLPTYPGSNQVSLLIMVWSWCRRCRRSRCRQTAPLPRSVVGVVVELMVPMPFFTTTGTRKSSKYVQKRLFCFQARALLRKNRFESCLQTNSSRGVLRLPESAARKETAKGGQTRALPKVASLFAAVSASN